MGIDIHSAVEIEDQDGGVERHLIAVGGDHRRQAEVEEEAVVDAVVVVVGAVAESVGAAVEKGEDVGGGAALHEAHLLDHRR